MTKRVITYDEILNFLERLPYHKFKEVVEHYSTNNKSSFEKDLDMMVTLNFQQRLEKLGINKHCPKCTLAIVVKCGKRASGIQIFQCKSCSTKFTLFTGTILEKTRWHWDIWIKVLEMTLNGYFIDSMLNVLKKDFGCHGINRKTVWLWRMKLINAIALFPMPTLTGVIQIDETFIRESQKGCRKLLSYIDRSDIRKPRYGYSPSKYGIMGPEFATVTTAIDNRGYCVCMVSNLGKLTKEIFVDLFEKHLISPAYICTDANYVYESYCNLFDIPHYVKPSNYQTTIFKNGYETPDYSNDALAKLTKEKNYKVLDMYIGYFAAIRNWRVEHGHYPTSQKDTELIFIDILKSKTNYTVTNIKTETLTLPKPTSRYVTLLKEETKKARKATSNKYFKFDEEDGFKTFNKREYFLTTKIYHLLKTLSCHLVH